MLNDELQKHLTAFNFVVQETSNDMEYIQTEDGNLLFTYHVYYKTNIVVLTVQLVLHLNRSNFNEIALTAVKRLLTLLEAALDNTSIEKTPYTIVI